ncbi:MAG: OsmC family protein [Vampirovibrionales bacterium]|nr:OsmC family protein [Vampirovibrionales bacterium]
MVARTSKAQWNGTLKEGKGTVTVGNNIFEGEYSFPSRFENGTGTNPEELVAAAHAACYSMALSAAMSKDGLSPKSVKTNAKVHLEKVGEGFEITKIELETEADVPGLEQAKFLEYAEGAKKGCPISKALAGVKDIQLNAKLLANV